MFSTFKGLTKSVTFHFTGHLLTHSHMDGALWWMDTCFLGRASKKGEERSCPVCERAAVMHGALLGIDGESMESR